MPSGTEEVSRILKHCNATGQSVITHGGLTNCVSGVEPTLDDMVLSSEKMTGIIDIDKVGGTATVEAGAVLQTVQEAMVKEGLYFPLDLGARGSCTIGGNVATNAGGVNVLRYGMMRNLVLGLESVLADGTVISSLNHMIKNNAGYDTKQFFIGTEGTLGVVTCAVLRLYPQPMSRQNAIVALNSYAATVEFLNYLQRQLAGTLSAYEVMWRDYYYEVTKEGWHRAPLSRDYPFYVIFQAEGSDPGTDDARFERVLTGAFDDGMIVDAVIPKSEAETREIWAVREDFEAILERSPYYLYDVSLPVREMAGYVDEVRRRVTENWSEGGLYTMGHMADGNLHFFVCPGQEGDNHHVADKCVYEPLKPVGGSVSAEHGIGIEKLDWLPHSRSREDIELMRTLKRSLDPGNILNPGRVLAA